MGISESVLIDICKQHYLSARVHTPDYAFEPLVVIIGNVAHHFNRQIKQAYGPHMEIEVVLHYHTSFCYDRLDIIMCNMMLNPAPPLKSCTRGSCPNN